MQPSAAWVESQGLPASRVSGVSGSRPAADSDLVDAVVRTMRAEPAILSLLVNARTPRSLNFTRIMAAGVSPDTR
jgi:hypothetical protein